MQIQIQRRIRNDFPDENHNLLHLEGHVCGIIKSI
jgi:hypothetical protein